MQLAAKLQRITKHSNMTDSFLNYLTKHKTDGMSHGNMNSQPIISAIPVIPQNNMTAKAMAQ